MPHKYDLATAAKMLGTGRNRLTAELKRRKAEQASQDGFEEAYAPGQFLKLCARQEGFGGHRPESQPLLGH